MWEWISFALIGCFAGMSAGLLGLGGGLVIVPSLLLVFHWQGLPGHHLVHVAVATSLMTITITSLSSMYAHQQHNNINWPVVKRLSLGLVIGGIIGAYFATLLDATLLQTCFAVYTLVVAIRMWLPMTPLLNKSLLKTPILLGVGNMIGMISAIVGIGGGSLTVPFMLMAKQSIKVAIGTAAACGFPISVAAVTGFVIFGQDNVTTNTNWLTGFVHWQAFLGIIGTSIIFAPIGAKLTKSLPVDTLRQIFSVALFAVAVSLFVTT